jgi:iron uptake system component EfeO
MLCTAAVPHADARPTRTSRAAALAGLSALALLTAGCGTDAAVSGQAAVSGAPTVTVGFTDDGCLPSPATVPAGPTNFEMRNAGASAVTEAEVMQGDQILGEKENLTPGLSGTFSLRLQQGTYTVYCPNARTEKSTLTVTAADTPAPSNTAHAELAKAVRTYRSYIQAESAKLLPATRSFAAAVSSGDLDEAKRLYPEARTHYETIEPVAESFGDLDPEIDARVNDVAAGAKWTGFHRIEKALWQDGTTKGMKPYADKLVKDVTRLDALVAKVQLQGAQVANGAVDLLGEVANSKITGEEDRYSHTDLSDFEANVDGVEAAITALTPAMAKVDPALQSRLRSQFAAVKGSLEEFRTADGFVAYTEANVPPTTRRELTGKVNTLAETLSKVAPALT